MDGCGYSVTLAKKPHQSDGILRRHAQSFMHYTACSVCSNWVNSDYCRDSSGISINCNNKKTCVTCGQGYATVGHTITTVTNTVTKTLDCASCGKALLTNISESWTWVSNNQVRVVQSATAASGITITAKPSSVAAHSLPVGSTVVLESATLSGSLMYAQYLITVPIGSTLAFNPLVYVTISDEGINSTHYFQLPEYLNELVPPSITSATISPVGTSWSNNKTLRVTATELFSSILNVGVFSLDGSTVLSPYGTAVKSGTTFTRDFTPLVEASAVGSKFLVKARDYFGNESSKEVTIRAQDAVAPTAPTITYSSGNATMWAQSKTVRVTTVDNGIGQVQIGFNSVSDYKLAVQSGNSYYRDFTFVGDVSGTQLRTFFLKDGLSNARTANINVGYLDNTKPNKTTLTSGGKLGATVWNPETFIIKITAGTDSLSGIKGIEYSLDNGASWILKTGSSYDLGITSSTKLLSRSVDNVDLRSDTVDAYINIDRGYPEISYG